MTSATKRQIRSRFKAAREGKQVEPPEVLAGELVKLLKVAAHDNPGEWSEAYAEHVINQFSSQYLRLCEVAPIRQKAGAR
jgi:hypothetical protein